MDSETASLFEGFSVLPANFLELSRHADGQGPSTDLDLLGLPTFLPDLDKSLLAPLDDRLQASTFTSVPVSINPDDLQVPQSQKNVEPLVSRDDDEDSVDDLSSSTQNPSELVGKESNRSFSEKKPDAPLTPAVRGNVSHTRRCRAKVNNNFDRLLEVLPPAPEGVEVKHKAQILNYAIERFHALRCRNVELEMKLALSSPYQMHRWVRSVVAKVSNLTDALKPFMALICMTKNYKYAELWTPTVRPGTDTTALRYVTGALPPNLQGSELERVRRYRSKSRKFVFRPRSGVPGRVFLTRRPEWLPLLNDPIAFPRAPHAVYNQVEVTFAVPVIVNGSVQMVVQFYDLNRRDYEAGTLNTANDIAEMFGKSYTGSAY